jgi:hypothetical protein
LIALVFNLLSQRQTRAGQRLIEQGQQQDRELAEAAAHRSEAAAALTEGYTQRVVDALEAIARSGLGGSAPAAPPPRVRWSMRHSVGDTYLLENIGDAPAWKVNLASDETLELVNVPTGTNLGPDEGMTFMAAPDMGTRDRTITVTWKHDEEGTPGGTWKYPLPARPPR